MYLLFDSEEAASSRESELSSKLGYPSPGTATVKYAQPLKHPARGEWALLICDIWNPSTEKMASAFSYITEEERVALVSASSLEGDGWFDYPEIGSE